MASERQIIANRINGAKSHDLITPEGRLASSRNPLTLGLLSEAEVRARREKKMFSTNEPNLRGKL